MVVNESFKQFFLDACDWHAVHDISHKISDRLYPEAPICRGIICCGDGADINQLETISSAKLATCLLLVWIATPLLLKPWKQPRWAVKYGAKLVDARTIISSTILCLLDINQSRCERPICDIYRLQTFEYARVPWSHWLSTAGPQAWRGRTWSYWILIAPCCNYLGWMKKDKW